MREIENFNEIAELFPWEPTFNKVIITVKTEEPDNNLILSDNTMSEIQHIVAVGPHTTAFFKVGDKVMIDIEKMIINERLNHNDTHETTPRIKIDLIENEGVAYAIIEDRFIKCKAK